MRDNLIFFWLDEDGAITVDFVVLTAAICLLGTAVVTTFSPAARDLANDIDSAVDNTATDFRAEAAKF